MTPLHRFVELTNVQRDIFKSFIYDKEIENMKIVLVNYLYMLQCCSLLPGILVMFQLCYRDLQPIQVLLLSS